LVREAGGVVVSGNGAGSPLDDGTYLAAANPELHAELIALARRAGGQR
jgi:fructose-1,6-bisphosphatase/inositol monophosphatase family enzyme